MTITSPDARQPLRRQRFVLIDALRGAALVAMFSYHLVWDLGFFGFGDGPQVQENAILDNPGDHRRRRATQGGLQLIRGEVLVRERDQRGSQVGRGRCPSCAIVTRAAHAVPGIPTG